MLSTTNFMRSVGLSIVLLGATKALGKSPPESQPLANRRDYVQTVHGLFHRSCLVEVAETETFDLNGWIVDATGNRRSIVPCLYPHFDSDDQLENPAAPQPYSTTGHPAYAYSLLGAQTAASWISANWTVPAVPLTQDGTSGVAFWVGLEPATTNFVLQPILAWAIQLSRTNGPFSTKIAASTATSYIAHPPW